MSEAKEYIPLRRAIAIDFDGCLCKPGAWPEIGAPNLARNRGGAERTGGRRGPYPVDVQGGRNAAASLGCVQGLGLGIRRGKREPDGMA